MSFLFIFNESHGFTTEAGVGNTDHDQRVILNPIYPQFRDPMFSRGHAQTGSHALGKGWFVTEPPANTSSDIWFHFRSLVLSSGSSAWAFTTPAGTGRHFELRIENSRARIVDFAGRDASVDITGSGDQSDFDVKINFGTGAFEIFQDGLSKGSGTHSWIVDMGLDCYLKSGLRGAASTAFTEMIITEAKPTIGMRVATLAPEAAASDNNLEGDIATVNEVSLSNDGMTTDGAGNFMFDYTDIDAGIDMSQYNIAAVTVSTVSTADETFVDKFVQNAVRINGNIHAPYDFLVSDTTSDSKSLNTIMTTNPETGAAWTEADINALEAGVAIGQPDLKIRIASDGSLRGWRTEGSTFGTLLGGKDESIVDAFYYSVDSDYLLLSPKTASGGWHGSTSARIHLLFEDGTYFVTNTMSYNTGFGGSFKSSRNDALEAKFNASVGQVLNAWVETF